MYKGYCLSKDAEEHLASHGLKNATYSVGAADVTDDIVKAHHCYESFESFFHILMYSISEPFTSLILSLD